MSEHTDYRETREFEESVVQRLERIATALEKSANVAREDLDFRIKTTEDQAVLVQRLTQVGDGLLTKPAGPQVEGRRARRG